MLPKLIQNNKDLAFVGGMILILIVLFSPIPPMMLDLAIIINFGFGLTILLLTFYVAKPVEFSTFPSLLLITTLFRLSLNVAATRLILTGGEAGEVIDSIGSFAVAGNFVVGLVVFFILVVVQYVVVTSGAQRVSEVAARFTLDSMPGQQMSIDADLNMGLIDQKEAVRRRQELEKEASFYGSMDGASKFVKGDAIAGVIILLIDIIAGWIIGVVQMGMGWSEALQKFTLLTIGDGIATQLPALVIAVATGIIVTRSSADKQLSSEIFRQLSSVPRIPLIVACVLVALMLLPGMPKWPIAILLAILVFAWLQIRKPETSHFDDEEAAASEERLHTISKSFPALEIALGPDLVAAWRDQEPVIMERIATLRQAHEDRLGIAFPAVKIREHRQIGYLDYQIKILGTAYSGARMEPDKMLAIKSQDVTQEIHGIETVDPAFNLPAVWIESDRCDTARTSGYTIVDPVSVLITHLDEVLRTHASTLLTRSTVVQLIDEVRDRQMGLIEELLPNLLTVSDVQRVLQNLLSEGVSIANIDVILEHLTDLARAEKDIALLTERVRERLGLSICNDLRDRHSDLAVISLDPRLENQIASSVASGAAARAMVVEPKLAEQIVRNLIAITGKMHAQGRAPVLLCGAEIRRHLRALTQRSLPKLSILSVNEIPPVITLSSFDVVRLESGENA